MKGWLTRYKRLITERYDFEVADSEAWTGVCVCMYDRRISVCMYVRRVKYGKLSSKWIIETKNWHIYLFSCDRREVVISQVQRGY